VTYQAGDRVALVHTSDPHTRLIPGTAGTVTGYDDRLAQLAVAWDDGSSLSMLLRDGDQVRLLDSPGPRPESLRSADGSRIIEVIPRADGSYHLVIRSIGGQVIGDRFPPTAARMRAVVQEWAASPAPPADAAPSLHALAEAVWCHVPVQPENPRHGTGPVPVEIFYGPLPDPGTGERRCGWPARFVTGQGPGGRTRRWSWARGRTLASALQAARAIQLAVTSPPASTPPRTGTP
jgi:hypothetical protein